jgi:hypothetical protein
MVGGEQPAKSAKRLNRGRWALLRNILNRRLPAAVFIYSEGY